MKTVAFIAEYNPFHNGHLYHLKRSKKETNSNFSIAIMSGSFVQRGEPSFIDKWTKAKIAVDNGIDLVLEMPTIYSIQNAELFAYGGIKLLDSLKIVDYISFGSECGNIKTLKFIAEIFKNEPHIFKQYLKQHLKKGYSYSKSKCKAFEKYLKYIGIKEYKKISDTLAFPNNILGIEYLKSLYKIESNIIPITIKRIESNHTDKKIKGKISSATSIRNDIFKNSLKNVHITLPKYTLKNIQDYIEKYGNFNMLQNYSQLILYKLRTCNNQELLNLIDNEKGLENRILKCSFKYNNIQSIINHISTKRYSKSRIQRMLIHLLLNLNKQTFWKLNSHFPKYIRVLAMNKNGTILLKKIKENSNIKIINKFTSYKKYNDPILKQTIEYDKKATDLFFLGIKNKEKRIGNADYFTSPYIKKSTF